MSLARFLHTHTHTHTHTQEQRATQHTLLTRTYRRKYIQLYTLYTFCLTGALSYIYTVADSLANTQNHYSKLSGESYVFFPKFFSLYIQNVKSFNKKEVYL
jgi:hypothetical protein